MAYAFSHRDSFPCCCCHGIAVVFLFCSPLSRFHGASSEGARDSDPVSRKNRGRGQKRRGRAPAWLLLLKFEIRVHPPTPPLGFHYPQAKRGWGGGAAGFGEELGQIDGEKRDSWREPSTLFFSYSSLPPSIPHTLSLYFPV